MFPKELGAKTGATVSSKYQIQLKKSICCRKNLEAPTAGKGRTAKEALQGPTQVLSCEYCQIFKSTCFEKQSLNGCSWKSATQWQIYRKEVFHEFYYLLKLFLYPKLYYDWMVLLCKLFYQAQGFFLLLFFSLKHILIINKLFHSTNHVRCYHFFIAEVIVESVNLLRMLN